MSPHLVPPHLFLSPWKQTQSWMGAYWGSIINDSLEGHWVRSRSFPLSRDATAAAPSSHPPSHPLNGVCPLSTTQIFCRTYIEGSNVMSQGVMAMRVCVGGRLTLWSPLLLMVVDWYLRLRLDAQIRAPGNSISNSISATSMTSPWRRSIGPRHCQHLML